MGSRVRLVAMGEVTGGMAGLRHDLESYERRWTRFDPESEISSIPVATWTALTTETFGLLARCDSAWRATGGAYDASMATTLADWGYDGSLAEARAGSFVATPGRWGRVRLCHETSSVWIPAGVTLDVGGIGKGFAADLVVAGALARGATSVLADIGGDVRVGCAGSRSEVWRIGIELDGHGARCVTLGLEAGAVATSSIARRAWGPPGDRRHHIIDPRTGRGADSDVSSVAVVAASAWWAEVVATSLVVLGSSGLARFPDIEALCLTRDGTVIATAGLEAAA